MSGLAFFQRLKPAKEYGLLLPCPIIMSTQLGKYNIPTQKRAQSKKTGLIRRRVVRSFDGCKIPSVISTYRRNEICSSGLVLIGDMRSPNLESGGTPPGGGLDLVGLEKEFSGFRHTSSTSASMTGSIRLEVAQSALSNGPTRQ
jgi:hypothetical protein